MIMDIIMDNFHAWVALVLFVASTTWNFLTSESYEDFKISSKSYQDIKEKYLDWVGKNK